MLVATFTGKRGEIKLRFRKVKNAKSYIILMTTTPEDENSYRQVTVSTRTTVMINNLDRGKEYFFKVIALGSAGEGAASDVAAMIAA